MNRETMPSLRSANPARSWKNKSQKKISESVREFAQSSDQSSILEAVATEKEVLGSL